ncbi:MAG: cupredoxin domain-containing protein [Rhodospirillales bacterium]|nr:cupredoxin domain-containing protein [Rhodospirillales bacterium]
MLAWALLPCLVAAAHAAPPPILTLRDHRFTPDHLVIPAGKRVRLLIASEEPTAGEFAAPSLGAEKMLRPGGMIGVYVGPLAPGRYRFYDALHPATARGTIEAR